MASSLGALAGKRIVLGVTGSIAAYKAVLVLRLLKKAGAEVRVILTHSGGKFVGTPTFQGLGAEVHSDMFQSDGELHVELAAWADCVLIAPATADAIARQRLGRADDLLGATLLCTRAPICVAPSMHPAMWAAASTQENANQLFERGVHFLGPVDGEVASGDVGLGRMAEPEAIVRGVARALSGPGSLSGRHIVITAGPTREAIDPVRAITNLSSGKMGYAIADVAAGRGAHVTLISGPVALKAPEGVHVVPVKSAVEMGQALEQALGPNLDRADALIMAAAVSDYRPATPSAQKLKKGDGVLRLELTPNPDLLADIGARRTTLRPVLIGFALETAEGDALIGLGRKKLIDKCVDMVVANGAGDSLEGDESVAFLVSPLDCTPLPRMSKARIGARIIGWLEQRLLTPQTQETTQ